jgi:hypothetical protein
VSALDAVLGALIPGVFGLGIVLPLLVALPTHAANQKLGGFNEVKLFQFYLGITGLYAIGIALSTALRWVLAAGGGGGQLPIGGD